MNPDGRVIEHELLNKNWNNAKVCDGFKCSNELKKIPIWKILSSSEKIHVTRGKITSRPISSCVTWQHGHNKHFQSVRGEVEFDFIFNHECWCGHEQSDHTSEILHQNISECKIHECDCRRFSP